MARTKNRTALGRRQQKIRSDLPARLSKPAHPQGDELKLSFQKRLSLKSLMMSKILIKDATGNVGRDSSKFVRVKMSKPSPQFPTWQKPVFYRNPSLLSFIWRSWRKRRNLSFALITTTIYTTARFDGLPKITKIAGFNLTAQLANHLLKNKSKLAHLRIH